MRRPVCKYCNNKVKDTNYVWVYEEKALIHKSCLNIKDVVVNAGLIKFGANVRR